MGAVMLNNQTGSFFYKIVGSSQGCPHHKYCLTYFLENIINLSQALNLHFHLIETLTQYAFCRQYQFDGRHWKRTARPYQETNSSNAYGGETSTIRCATKFRQHKCLVVPILIYKRQTWTPLADMEKIIQALQNKCLRRLPHTSGSWE